MTILKFLPLLVSILITYSTCAQPLIFKGQKVDTVIINSSNYRYHFDTAGTGTTTEDRLIIGFDSVHENYQIVNFKRTLSSFTLHPKTENFKEQDLKKMTTQRIGSDILFGVLQAFSVRFIEPNSTNIRLDKKDFIKLCDRKHLLYLLKLNQKETYFKRFYPDKKDKNLIFKGCQSLDTFKLFLSSKHFDTSSYVVVSDFSEEIKVIIQTNTSRYIFEGKYPNFLKQPWYDLSDTTQNRYKYKVHDKADSLNFDFAPEVISKQKIYSILNFDIGYYLTRILPKKFLLVNSISTRRLTDEYILWYLNRRDIIYLSSYR